MHLFKIIISISLLWNTSNGNYRIYETITKNNSTVFDCLYNLVIEGDDSPQMKKDLHIDSIPFCRQSPMKNNNDILPMNSQQWTFDQLRRMNISFKQLYNWYVPLDIIEEYLLEQSNGTIVNCSNKNNYWFGNRCQYTLDSDRPLKDILWDRFDTKDETKDDLLTITNGTCYLVPNDQCQSILCLDWREICDGKIDCTDGFDEYHCHLLEKNECDEINEFRCLNGQCIDKTFYRDEYADCMDYTDEAFQNSDECFYKFYTRCEDHSCPNMWFSCGDGSCYDGPINLNTTLCGSKKDYLYFQKMSSSTLILFSHIHFIYKDLKPEIICYNQSLCPYLFNTEHFEITTTSLNGLTCQLLDNKIIDVKRFVQSCSLLPSENQCFLFKCNDGSKCFSQHRLSDGYKDCSNGEDEYQNNTCLLNDSFRFKCDQGTRCIHPTAIANKFVRIFKDCNDGKDETYFIRSLCKLEYSDECRSFLNQSRRFNFIFVQLCNGFTEISSDLEGNTDETDCRSDEWNCVNFHTKCDNIWNCPNGEDELGCGTPNLASRHCDKTTHFCLDIQNGLPICLPLNKANDGIIDCIGSIDERSFCRSKYPYDYVLRYRCLNSDICISPFQICDCHQDCPLNDDETIACRWMNNGQTSLCHKHHFRCRNGIVYNHTHGIFRCDGMNLHCVDGEDELFCDLIEYHSRTRLHSLDIDNYPLQKQVKQQTSYIDLMIIWYCNRGLYVRSLESTSGYICLCPIYYYGDRCQYQRKRITTIFHIELTGSFNRNFPTMKFIVLLIRENEKRIILSHEQFLYSPLEYCSPKYIIHLVYPINDPLSLYSNDSIEVLIFTSSIVEHHSTWIFKIPFHFLPVQRIVKRLFLSNIDTFDNSIERIINKKNSSSCSLDSFYIGYDINLNRDICVCPLNRIGSRCLIPFNPCTNSSCNYHGECYPNDERAHPHSQFRCICELEWSGNQCENKKFRFHVSFTDSKIISSSSIALIHLIIPLTYREDLYLTSFYRFHEEILNLTFLFEYTFDSFDSPGLISFIQLFNDLNHVSYYLLNIIRQVDESLNEMNAIVDQKSRCRSINELLDKTILSQPYLRRVKYYQQICLKKNLIEKFPCFYDEQLMCLCDKTNHAYCFNLNSTYSGCPWNKCSERGICIKDKELCPTYSFCLCNSCSYGSVCQFSTEGYILSLDAIIGSHIKPMITNLYYQTTTIQITFIIIIILFIIGIILNILSIGTFNNRTTQEVGSAFYLVTSAFLGLLIIILLMVKIILLLYDKQNNISCSLIEFSFKWFLTSCEWLNSCVAIERCSALLYKTKFSRLKSKYISKCLIPSIIILVGSISLPEIFFRQMIIDEEDKRNWCVFTVNNNNRPKVFKSYVASNLFLFFVPIIINFVSSFIILRKTFELKRRMQLNANRNTNQADPWRTRLLFIKKQIMKHKHILLGPLLLAILSFPRILFLFIFVCKKLDRRPFLSLFAYLISFIPSMTILFLFILPSTVYRAALRSLIKRILCNRILN
ncbi:unnamed protein product [Adineta steineri]|uniref:Uncharacterized protein n=2 Tax=Adineta steineri TaxID=433720 RepID=A0A814ZUD5_9BILA|nr:unnamed protein product [Adineta steineri]